MGNKKSKANENTTLYVVGHNGFNSFGFYQENISLEQLSDWNRINNKRKSFPSIRTIHISGMHAFITTTDNKLLTLIDIGDHSQVSLKIGK